MCKACHVYFHNSSIYMVCQLSFTSWGTNIQKTKQKHSHRNNSVDPPSDFSVGLCWIHSCLWSTDDQWSHLQVLLLFSYQAEWATGLSSSNKLAWACSHTGDYKIPRSRKNRSFKTFLRLRTCTLLPLSHSNGQNKSQGHPRFKEWENRLHFLMKKIYHTEAIFAICHTWLALPSLSPPHTDLNNGQFTKILVCWLIEQTLENKNKTKKQQKQNLPKYKNCVIF